MLGRLAEFMIFGFAPLLVGVLALPMQSMAEDKVIGGEVLYRERIALPPDAVLTVQLMDLSPDGEPSTVIGQQIIPDAGQVPIKFELRFDPDAIQPDVSYALEANITVDHTLWFENDTRYEVDPLNAGPQTLVLSMVRKSSSEPASNENAPAGLSDTAWLAEDIEGGGVIDYAQSTLRIGADGKVSGKGACNNYFGAATIDGSSIKIGPLGSTFMACPPAIMDQERKFFDALGKAASFRIEDGKLYLADNEGRDILRFASQN